MTLRSLFRLPLVLGALALAGCSAIPKMDGARFGPFYTPANVHGVSALPESVRRIALLPCAGADSQLTETTLLDLDRILATTLTGSARAEITSISVDQLARFGARTRTLSTSTLPVDFLKRVAAETGADAVILTDVTAYSAYPPLSLGLRSRLVDIKTGAALWNFDNIFSANVTAVANSARAHLRNRASATLNPSDLSYIVLQNPLAFADYAAGATWSTLPPRVVSTKVSP
jgi:hypothetical protein